MFRIEKGLNLQKSCEFMVIGLFEQTDPFGQWMNQLDGNLQTQLRTMVRSKDISTKFNAVTIIHTLGLSRIKRFVFVGLGKKENLTKEPLRELLGKVFQTIEKSQGTSLSIAFDSFLTDQITAEVMSHIIGEAFHLALYTFPGYKTKKEKREKNTLHEVTIFTEQDSHFVDTTVKRGEVFGKATNAARMLVNTPSNLLTARDLAQYAKQLAEEYAFRVDILGEEEMEQLGMNAILAVNQGSSQPPQIIVLTYEGNKADHNFIGLVGKGLRMIRADIH